jgi:hypothetical protein
MPVPRNEASTHAAQAPRHDSRAASPRAAAPKKAGDGAPRGAPRPEETGDGKRRRRGAGRAAPEAPEAALRGLFRGLRAGDLETVLLTVAMAAEENRMPCADPEEPRRRAPPRHRPGAVQRSGPGPCSSGLANRSGEEREPRSSMIKRLGGVAKLRGCMINRVEQRSGPLDACSPGDPAPATECAAAVKQKEGIETVRPRILARPVGDDDGRA